MTVDVELFLRTIRQQLQQTPRIAPEKDWVAGGQAADGRAVVLYTAKDGGALLGRIWNLDSYAVLFGTEDAAKLARAAYTSEISEPEGPAVLRQEGWADGLVENTNSMRWLGLVPDTTPDSIV
ncbi:hypothetical protein [Cryobacterium lyxosi]|uniref:Uncharacterized protein n=1 Tax=Cryobacterium lyxosi TaxID=1259228 RepID=A0A4V3INQ5_9MICO|nr:hypothetical protein [Cryobacterium lyxosi]TFD23998.1 hypothetical protein E3T27_14565 [Cryobacterium lyxosi]